MVHDEVQNLIGIGVVMEYDLLSAPLLPGPLGHGDLCKGTPGHREMFLGDEKNRHCLTTTPGMIFTPD